MSTNSVVLLLDFIVLNRKPLESTLIDIPKTPTDG